MPQKNLETCLIFRVGLGYNLRAEKWFCKADRLMLNRSVGYAANTGPPYTHVLLIIVTYQTCTSARDRTRCASPASLRELSWVSTRTVDFPSRRVFFFVACCGRSSTEALRLIIVSYELSTSSQAKEWFWGSAQSASRRTIPKSTYYRGGLLRGGP